jgi:hypothetical protein
MESCVLLRRRTFFLWTAAVLLTALCVPTPAHAQAQPVDDLLKAMLFWFDMPGPKQTTELTADVRKSLDTYRARIEAFKPSFVVKGTPGRPEHSLQLKRIALERVLFGLFDVPGISALATEYARRARLSYEWEGFADGPLFEADVADAFLEGNPDSPIAPYLNLFAGHRKMCAVSGLQGLDPSSEKGRRIAQEAVAQLTLARNAQHPIIKLVAERVLESRRCFGDG